MFETKTINFVNETSLGKFLKEETNWKEFYKLAKDKSNKKYFEKEYGDLLNKAYIASALKKSTDFNSFMKLKHEGLFKK